MCYGLNQEVFVMNCPRCAGKIEEATRTYGLMGKIYVYISCPFCMYDATAELDIKDFMEE
ncbi:MAG TPA: hypothetical protein DCS07_12765 [Bdellovibrionales bacterium]|nr:hypothetical protein [Bdellovibrionales bacterium]